MPTIRKATLSDFDNLLKLNKDLFLFEKKFSETYNENWPYETAGKEYFARLIVGDKSACFVAEENGEIVGYLMAYCGEYAYRNVNPISELENMFVKEEFRNKGIGSKLVEEFKKWSKEKGAKRLKVMLYATNLDALEFYKKHGFADFAVVLEQDPAI